MKKIIIAFFSLASVFIVSLTITDDTKNKATGDQMNLETDFSGRHNESAII